MRRTKKIPAELVGSLNRMVQAEAIRGWRMSPTGKHLIICPFFGQHEVRHRVRDLLHLIQKEDEISPCNKPAPHVDYRRIELVDIPEYHKCLPRPTNYE